jgi:hypothetical protein
MNKLITKLDTPLFTVVFRVVMLFLGAVLIVIGYGATQWAEGFIAKAPAVTELRRQVDQAKGTSVSTDKTLAEHTTQLNRIEDAVGKLAIYTKTNFDQQTKTNDNIIALTEQMKALGNTVESNHKDSSSQESRLETRLDRMADRLKIP